MEYSDIPNPFGTEGVITKKAQDDSFRLALFTFLNAIKLRTPA
jgi:hypothetical protein